MSGFNRRATRNFLRQGTFPGIRALRQTVTNNTKKKGPAGKNLWFFLLETFKNCTSDEKFNPYIALIRTFPPSPPKGRAPFSNFQKRVGVTSPLLHPVTSLI